CSVDLFEEGKRDRGREEDERPCRFFAGDPPGMRRAGRSMDVIAGPSGDGPPLELECELSLEYVERFAQAAVDVRNGSGVRRRGPLMQRVGAPRRLVSGNPAQ